MSYFASELFQIFYLKFGGQVLCYLIWIVPQNITFELWDEY